MAHLASWRSIECVSSSTNTRTSKIFYSFVIFIFVNGLDLCVLLHISIMLCGGNAIWPRQPFQVAQVEFSEGLKGNALGISALLTAQEMK